MFVECKSSVYVYVSALVFRLVLMFVVFDVSRGCLSLINVCLYLFIIYWHLCVYNRRPHITSLGSLLEDFSRKLTRKHDYNFLCTFLNLNYPELFFPCR